MGLSMVTVQSDQTDAGRNYPENLYRSDNRATLLPTVDHIDEAAVDRYHADGYVAVGTLFDPARIDAALTGLNSLLLDPRGAGIEFEVGVGDRLADLDAEARMNVVRKFMWFADHDERLRTLARDPVLMDVARRLIGDQDIALIQDMALLKPPGGGREKPWHQDNAYFNIEPGTPIVGVWIALDDATPENGCMHVLPGSHREGPVLHFQRRDWQICDSDVQIWRDLVVPLPAGGALFFDGLIHHGTPANRTNRRRRAVQFHYAPATAVRVTDERRMELFGSEGKNVSC